MPFNLDIDTLLNQLHTNQVEVTFTKVTGEQRTMRCTLNESFLPAQKETTKTKTPNPDVIPVFDLEKNAWRSFRKDSIVSFEVKG
jgi:hypothetical protein